ncbi:MAG: ADP-ribosylglycohydrolase family protein [Alphaproteobacteria bacterium]|nr:ADP-ribosylglycohydrolase family protein [Alphaproteobacteria bacterium]
MFGAVIGDIIGSVYEFHNVKTKDFPLWTDRSCFTDDTVCTIAVADALMHGKRFDTTLREWCRHYPDIGYGQKFKQWVNDDKMPPYHSWGNGAIMRLSPVAYLSKDRIHAVLNGMDATAITHNSSEAISATEAFIDAFYDFQSGVPGDTIRSALSFRYGYSMNRSVDYIRMNYNHFYVSCHRTLPEAVICVIEAENFEDAIRNAVSLGGDSDTLAAVAGALAEARFGVPEEMKSQARSKLDLPMQRVLDKMYQTPKTIIRQHFSYHPVTGEKMRD